MQVFPQGFIPFLAVCMHRTGSMRSGDPDAAMSNPKAHTFAPFEGTFYPKVGTIECVKVHHCPFQCLLSGYVEEVKPGDLLEMPHTSAKQSCSEQANAVSQERWKNTNDWAGGIKHRGPGHRWGMHWWGKMNACIWKYFSHFQISVLGYWVVLM